MGDRKFSVGRRRDKRAKASITFAVALVIALMFISLSNLQLGEAAPVEGGVGPVGAAGAIDAGYGYDVGTNNDVGVGTKFHSPLGGFGKRVRVRTVADASGEGRVRAGAGIRAAGGAAVYGVQNYGGAGGIGKGGGAGAVAYGKAQAGAVYGSDVAGYAYASKNQQDRLRLHQKIDLEKYTYGIFGNSDVLLHRKNAAERGSGRSVGEGTAYGAQNFAAKNVGAKNAVGKGVSYGG